MAFPALTLMSPITNEKNAKIVRKTKWFIVNYTGIFFLKEVKDGITNLRIAPQAIFKFKDLI